MVYKTSLRKTLIAASLGLMVSGIAQGADSGSSDLGSAIADTAITAKIKAKFLGNEQLKGTDLDVKTSNGAVSLSGTAPNADEKAAAEQLAKSVDGVKSVDDQVTIAASTSSVDAMKASAGEKADAMKSSASQTADSAESSTKSAAKKTKGYAKDSWITTKVKSKLMADSVTKGLSISVDTEAGVVKLSGALSTQAQIDRAVSIAKAVKHVKSVDSADLKVGTS